MGKKQRTKEERRKVPPAEEGTPGRLPKPWLWTLPVLLAAIFSFNVLQNGYGWDDEVIIGGLKSPDRWIGIFLPSTSPDSTESYYRPLIGVSYLLDWMVWGREPFGFHLSVWLAHILNTALVFFLARSLAGGHRYSLNVNRSEIDANHESRLTNNVLPLVASSLFAVHPSHVEAVAWIAGRNDVFYTTFVLISILLYAGYCRTRRTALLASSLLFFFLGLLTKEAAVGFVFLFPVMDYLNRGRSSPAVTRSWNEIVLGWIWPAMVLGIYLWMRTANLASPYGKPDSGRSLFNFSLMDGIVGFGYYVKTLLWPFPHDPFVSALPESTVFRAFSLFVALLIGAGFLRALHRRQAVPAVGIAWCVFLLAPAVAATVLRVAATPVSERYVYGPSVGFFLVIGWMALLGVERIRSADPTAPSVGAAALSVWIGTVAVFGIMSWNRNTVWRDHLRFWQTAVTLSPEAGFAHRNLGIHLAKADRYEEAEPHLEKAVALYEGETGPDSTSVADSLHYLAQLYQKRGAFDRAEPVYRRALAIREAHRQENPLAAASLHNLAALYRKTGRFSEAEKYYERAVQVRRRALGPDHPDLANSLDEMGMLYYDLGDFARAEPHLKESLRIRESHLGSSHKETASSLNNVAMLYGALGKVTEAEPLFQRAIAIYEGLRGEEAALAQVLANYAGLKFGRGLYSETEPLLNRALKLQEEAFGPNHPSLADNLENYAALLHRLNRIEEADGAMRRAMEIRNQSR